MDPVLTFVLLSALLVVLFMVGIPVYIAFLICNFVGLYFLMGTTGLGLFINSITGTASFNALTAVPFFLLMGDILYRASAVDALVESANSLLGRIRGRLYILCVIVATILAALSGSAMASSAMLSRTLFPVMMARKYDRKMSLGVILGGACLAPIIPPSVMAILIATIAQVSIADMFVAGIIPGLLLSFLFVSYILIRVRLEPGLAPDHDEDPIPVEKRGVLRAIAQLLPFSAVILFVMGSTISGLATPSESAVMGVVGALFVAAILKTLNWTMLVGALKSAALVSAMIMAIMVSSQLFSQLLAFSGFGDLIRNFVEASNLSPGMMLFIMMAIPFFVCMFLDEVAAMLIFIPIYSPLLGIYHFEPIWFWTLFLVNMTLGAIAPPVGYVLFVVKGVLPEMSMMEIFYASLPYVVIFIFAMFLMGAFPQLVLFLL